VLLRARWSRQRIITQTRSSLATHLSCASTQPAAASASAGGVAARKMACQRRMSKNSAPPAALPSMRCGVLVRCSRCGSCSMPRSMLVRSRDARGLKRFGRSSDGLGRSCIAALAPRSGAGARIPTCAPGAITRIMA
jgi:hypothetical protein